ncbi:MAG TPA: EGF domain-containing protein, partial [Steroidobacteraceae bacterium]|nr:EGF domain-containing protein [Steroidobacteraceae bacterium]
MLERVTTASARVRGALPSRGDPLAASPRRLQRLRRTAPLRDLVAETGFTQSQLIQPLFIAEDPADAGAIAGLPGNLRLTQDTARAQLDADLEVGVRQYLLFPVPARKHARDFDPAFICETIAALRLRAGKDASLWLDTCLCGSIGDGGAGDAGSGPSCAVANGGCDPSAYCTPTAAGRVCTCPIGFAGDGLTCVGINECLTNN